MEAAGRATIALNLAPAGEAFAKRNDGKITSVFEPFALFGGKSTAVFRLLVLFPDDLQMETLVAAFLITVLDCCFAWRRI